MPEIPKIKPESTDVGIEFEQSEPTSTDASEDPLLLKIELAAKQEELERQTTRQIEQELRHLKLKWRLHQRERTRRTKGKQEDSICFDDDMDVVRDGEPVVVDHKKHEPADDSALHNDMMSGAAYNGDVPNFDVGDDFIRDSRDDWNCRSMRLVRQRDTISQWLSNRNLLLRPSSTR
jgi:hypothetical protein